MQSLRKRLEIARQKNESNWGILEKDYVLSWILYGIASHPTLPNALVFKGGTALKKCYFGDYRFSEDIDFSSLATEISGNNLENAIKEAANLSELEMNKYFPAKIVVTRYSEKNPHPEGQEAFAVRVQLPWHRTPTVRILVEITHQEVVVLQPCMRKIIHEYGDPIDNSIPTYPLEEIVAEKLRAILQQTKKLHERGWGRSRVRDYYDIWRIVKQYRTSLKFDLIPSILDKKCETKGVNYEGMESFFDVAMMQEVKISWKRWLEPLVLELPKSETVLIDLRHELKEFLPVSTAQI